MTQPLAETLEILERTPGMLHALLAGISPSWHDATEGPGTWSPLIVVGHLIHADEAVWLPRAQTILQHGEAQPFAPGDPEAQRTLFAGWSLAALLARFAEVRQRSLGIIGGWRLSTEDLERRGRHSVFGSVTLGELLAAWAVHDLNHVAQAVRVMARRSEDAVGPWREAMAILEWKRER